MYVQEFTTCKSFNHFVRACNDQCDSLEAGFVLLNTSEEVDPDNAEKLDEAIQDGCLEFLKDNLATMTCEDKNTGSLLSQDEKKGVERLVEGMQLVPWASMERITRPLPSMLPTPAPKAAASAPTSEETKETAVS